jgi:hypothetical protein
MKSKLARVLAWLGVVILQLIMTQVVTFLASLVFPNLEWVQTRIPWVFAIFLATAFSIGTFLVGWLAIHWNWLRAVPRIPMRLLGTVLGAILPLILALFLYPTLEPGNPFFLVSILGSILGFHFPGLFPKKQLFG